MENKKEFPKFTVLVPANHEITIKPVPEKEYFSQRPSEMEEQEILSKTSDSNDIARRAREEVEQYYSALIDHLGLALPPKMFIDLGKKYMEIRKKKFKKISIEEGLLKIKIGSKELLVGLHHVLKIIQQNDTGAGLAALKKSDQEIFKKYIIVKKVSNWHEAVGISQEERQLIVEKAQARKNKKAADLILRARVNGPKNS